MCNNCVEEMMRMELVAYIQCAELATESICSSVIELVGDKRVLSSHALRIFY
jgi:hypothetical protein